MKYLAIDFKSKSFFVLFFSIILLNYDIIFFVFNTISFNGLPCRTIYVREGPAVTTDYLTESSFDTSTVGGFNFGLDTSSKLVPKSVIFIND